MRTRPKFKISAKFHDMPAPAPPSPSFLSLLKPSRRRVTELGNMAWESNSTIEYYTCNSYVTAQEQEVNSIKAHKYAHS